MARSIRRRNRRCTSRRRRCRWRHSAECAPRAARLGRAYARGPARPQRADSDGAAGRDRRIARGAAPIDGRGRGAVDARADFNMLLLTVFGFAALLLAAIGVYGLMSYSVEQRTQEIGIRLALGAGLNQVRNMVVVQGMGLAAA